MKGLLFSVGALLLTCTAMVLLWGRSRGRIASSRGGRVARVTRLSARLSASWIGARIRRAFAPKERRERIHEARRQRDAQLVADAMGEMKGVLMKLGQMLSFVSDDIPEQFRVALSSLQASAPPMDFALLRHVAEQELGSTLERAFARFDATALAAASIGQVHRAQLPSGEEVVVKIQYPGVAEAIASDLANVELLYRFVGLAYPALDPGPLVEELRSRILEELDYRYEAKNQRAFSELYEDHPFIRVPKLIASHSTARVITSEYVAGRNFQGILAADPAIRNRFAEILFRFVFGSIFQFHLFNGDPHPGNYLYDDEGHAVFLDFGCVKYFLESTVNQWACLIRAHLAGDVLAFRTRAIALGFLTSDAPVSPELLYDYFSQFYEPFQDDRQFTFSPRLNAQSLRLVFAPKGRFAPMNRMLNMPPHFVFANRLQWGVYSILSSLGASGNWHRMMREFLDRAPPSTDLGRIDHEFRDRWSARRALNRSFGSSQAR